MAAKKKTKKKQSKKAVVKKMTPKKKAVAKKVTAKRKLPKKKAVKKKSPAKTTAAGTKTSPAMDAARNREKGRKRQHLDDLDLSSPELGARSGGQSGDIQGLSDREGADSESVDELMEEGNAFEADAVAGVEEADDSDEREVHTHEVPEDDVPEEYLDED
jgi:hypothetical protein